MSIQNPGRFGLKTFLVGLAIGVTVGIGLVASAICPPVVVIPAVLIFVFANSPLFAWAGAHAAVAVIAAAGVLAGLATTFAVQTMDVIASAIWRVGSWLASACFSKKEAPVVTPIVSSNTKMNALGLQQDGERTGVDETSEIEPLVHHSSQRNLGRRQDTAKISPPDLIDSTSMSMV